MINAEKEKHMYSQELFEDKLRDILSRMSSAVLEYKYNDFGPYAKTYQFIERYAHKHQLMNTCIALAVLRGLMIPNPAHPTKFRRDANRHAVYFGHALAVTRLLVNLDLPVNREETDYMLAASLCHVIVEMVDLPQRGAELTERYRLDPYVYELISLITRDDPLTEEQEIIFYERIRDNKLASMIRIADRANLVEQLHRLPIWTAQEYIYETRTYFFPLCLYARDHYPELSPKIRVLTEKMRYMMEVIDILSARFRDSEAALTREIISLEDDNFRLRSRIDHIGGTIPEDLK